MGQITITSVGWANLPAVKQYVTVSRRRSDLPDIPGNYVLISNYIEVLPNGNLTVPLVISGLVDGLSYYVKIVNNCGGGGTQTLFNIPVTTVAPTTLPVTTGPGTTAPVSTTEQIRVDYDYKEINGANAFFAYGFGPVGTPATGPGFFGNAAGTFFVPVGQRFQAILNNQSVIPQPSANQYYLQIRDLTAGTIVSVYNGTVAKPAGVQPEGTTDDVVTLSGHHYLIEAIVNWTATTVAPTTVAVTTSTGTTIPPTTAGPAVVNWNYTRNGDAIGLYGITSGPTGIEDNSASGISTNSGTFLVQAGGTLKIYLSDSAGTIPNPNYYYLKVENITLGTTIYTYESAAGTYWSGMPPLISGHTYNVTLITNRIVTTVAPTTIAPTTAPITTAAPTTVPPTTAALVTVLYQFTNGSGVDSIYLFQHGAVGNENFVTSGGSNISSSFTLPVGTKLRSFTGDNTGSPGIAGNFYLKVENITDAAILYENNSDTSNEFTTAALIANKTYRVTISITAPTTIPPTTAYYCPLITGDNGNVFEGAKPPGGVT